jgi:hypothetical protein
VFPVIRLLLWAVIAVSLAYLAFFRGAQQDQVDTAAPTVDLTPAEVVVTRGTVENTVQLTGTVVADPAVPVKATATGVVRRLRAQAGAVLAAGDPVVEVTVVVERPPVTAADGTVTTPAPQTKTVTVAAPAAGTLATLDVLVDQPVAVGEDVATLSPGTLTVQAPLTQDQQFRLLAPPAAAEVTVPGGPAPFSCTDVRTGIPAGTTQDPPAADPFAPPQPESTGAAVTCRVPAGVPAFAGLSAQVSLQAGVATDVLVLPVTAVRGSVANGVAYRVGEDGAQAEAPVVLGLTDGEQVEVREGLAEGDRVLQFVPGLEDLSGQGGFPGEAGFGVGG